MTLYQEKIVTTDENINDMIEAAWSTIAPSWPLKNLIAVNPLCGWEDIPFEQALKKGHVFFQQKDLPASMLDVNRHSIKWLQAFFDEGIATIQMPIKHKGFLTAILELLPYDNSIRNEFKKKVVHKLSHNPKKIICECLYLLNIPNKQQTLFITLLLTTLPGWAGYIKYRTSQADTQDQQNPNKVSQEEYLAFRILLTYLIWPKSKDLLLWHQAAQERVSVEPIIKKIELAEKNYRNDLFEKLKVDYNNANKLPDAQLVFCIDVRSEPFRKALEQQGNYETLGFAGFFGLPISIHNNIKGEHYASCPVLLQPSHEVGELPVCNNGSLEKKYQRKEGLSRLYQSLKFTFTAPFALVETLGPLSGIKMALRNIFPKIYFQLKKSRSTLKEFLPTTDGIPFEQQCFYAENALRTMGLISNFATLVVFCGHGSQTENNAYSTALDCGACGGHHGAPNAILLATILNAIPVREKLYNKGIIIPERTQFLAAEHNTTTDEMELFDKNSATEYLSNINNLKADLEMARKQNCESRAIKLSISSNSLLAAKLTAERAKDWSQVRPEWGLARNAAFIVAPRAFTKNIDLDGRAFLHSYNWQEDLEGNFLTAILTAPMIVGHWINSQYLFSTIDNIAFGGGSKISKNITGKIGIMQGNASDLMQGLPLQSVYESDKEAYHQAVRLMTVVYAPQELIMKIVKKQTTLQKLIKNGWVTMTCIDPKTKEKLILNRDLNWLCM